jgi:hypothetical protein
MKPKNMELSRLLLLGFLDDQQQMIRIQETICEIKEALEHLEGIKTSMNHQLEQLSQQLINQEDFTEFYLSIMNIRSDSEFLNELIASVEGNDFKEVFYRINKFGGYTLQLGIDECRFYLEWFENIKKKIEEDRLS